VFILKVVKVLCFDTLLQVLILKVDRGGRRNRRQGRTKVTAKDNAETQRLLRYRRGTPPPGCPVDSLGIPHPRYFGKRGCKLLKTKDRSYRIRDKRLQAIEKARVRAGGAGRVSEVSSR
jgi:hypothetical protein